MSEWCYELTPLTPLHIATGDPIEPFEYVIYEGRLYKFDPEAFLLALAPEEQNRFVDLAGTNLLAARKFLSERGNLVKQIAEYSVPVSATAAAYYEQRLSNPQSDLSIGVFIRTNHRAYIPGSSLKGALRTALLYVRATRDDQKITEWNAKTLEQSTFEYRNPGDDPFKYFKISDSAERDEMTQLATVNVHTKTNEGWSKGKIPLLREVTWGVLTNHAKARDVTVTFSVLVNETVARAARQDRRAQWFEGKQIIAACRAFYGEHLKQEARFHQDDESSYVFYQALQKWAEQLPNNACLIRLGWGSGFDAVTVRYARAGAKDISTPRPSRKKRGKESKGEKPDLTLYTPASRRLAEGGAPLGWAELRIVRANDASGIESLEKRLAQVGEIVVQEETPEPEKATPIVTRAESTTPDVPATQSDIEALRARFAKPAPDTRGESPKPDAGEKERRKQEEIMRRMRKGL